MTDAHILIVEDRLIVAKDIENSLNKLGYAVPAIATSKSEAIQQAGTLHPDLILMDIHLDKGIEGIEAADEIRIHFDIPVVYLTAYADDETLQQARLTEPFGYLLKPFTDQELHSTIEMALYKYRMDREYRKRLEHLVEQRTAELKASNEQLQQEIVERKHAENALRASETQYRLLADSVADGIVIVQAEQLVFVNEAYSAICRRPTQSLIGANPLELFLDEDKPLIRQWLHRIRTLLTEHPFQAQCYTAPGQEVWTEWTPTCIVWEGKPAVLLTVRDITEQKLQEHEMEAEKALLEQENLALKAAIHERYRLGDIVGKSFAMQQLYEEIIKASVSEANVLITGESGTGKELVARTIHHTSRRHQQRFVAVNCGAISEGLFESAFFGHRKGSFTGAERDKKGFLDAAHCGTLFLDEVAEFSQTMQVKLLRVIENREYIPVGDNSPKHIDVRIIAATNKPLTELQQKQHMRKDFFYRIHVITIAVPPLRAHKEDIPLLLDHFLACFAANGSPPRVPASVMEALMKYDWPGNVRELQNQIQRFLVGQHLTFLGEVDENSQYSLPDADVSQAPCKLRNALDSYEKRCILHALRQHHWHRTNAARSLGIPRRTLHRKIKKFGIE